MVRSHYKNSIKIPMVFIGLLFFSFILIFLDLDTDKPAMKMTLAVAVLMAIWWVTEAIPIGITSLLPIVLFPVMGVLDGKIVSGTYINYIVFLFLGGFLLALALEKWELHRRIALKILNTLGNSPFKILLGFMVSSSFLSMWISNTATTMMMLPIVSSVSGSLEQYYNKKTLFKFNTALLLGIAYSSSIGGITTLIGTAPNLSFVRIFEILYPNSIEISFSQWFIFTLPLTLFKFFVTLYLLYFLFLPKGNYSKLSKDFFKKAYIDLGAMNIAQKRVLVLFTILIFLWIFRKPIQIGDFHIWGWSQLFGEPKWINDGTSAIFIAILLFIIPAKKDATPLLTWDISKKIPWDVVLLLGGGFALAKAFSTTGLADYLGRIIVENANNNSLFMMFSATGLMSFATEFTSNAATTEMLLPIVGGIANQLKVHPLFLMFPVTLAASMAFMFPVATPPNAIVFGTRKLKVRDMLKAGFILNTIAIISICLLTYFWAEVAFNINFEDLPIRKN